MKLTTLSVYLLVRRIFNVKLTDDLSDIHQLGTTAKRTRQMKNYSTQKKIRFATHLETRRNRPTKSRRVRFLTSTMDTGPVSPADREKETDGYETDRN